MSLQVCDSASLLGSGGVVRLLMLQSTVTLLSSFVSSVHASLSFLFLLDHVSDCCTMVGFGVSMWDHTWAGIVSLALSLRFCFFVHGHCPVHAFCFCLDASHR